MDTRSDRDGSPLRSRCRRSSSIVRSVHHSDDPCRIRKSSNVAEAISPASEEARRLSASSLASISAPPSEEEVREGGYPEDVDADEKERKPAVPRVYAPFSLPVLASLAGPSVFGVLARLGLLAITSYDGRAIFPLAWAQAVGCLIMGFMLGLKDQVGAL